VQFAIALQIETDRTPQKSTFSPELFQIEISAAMRLPVVSLRK
jgi:hypothetical protein